jgi:ribosome-associated protein
LQPKKIALLARDAAEDKKAENAVVMDVAKLTSLAHYFIVTHGTSDRHVRAIAQNIIDVMDEKKVKLWHKEGLQSGQWVLLDYGAFITKPAIFIISSGSGEKRPACEAFPRQPDRQSPPRLCAGKIRGSPR